MSSEIPDPFAHPDVLAEPTGTIGARPGRRGTARLGTAFFIGGLGWVFANTVLTGVITAAKLAILAPEDKVVLLGLITALTAIVSTVILFFWGAISDLTRSRFGRRTPWIIIGAIGGLLGLVFVALADTVPLFIVALVIYSIMFNALPPAMLAVFPDRVPRTKRGTMSAVYGGAQLVAGSVAVIVASGFITAPDTVLYIAGGVLLVSAVLFVLIAPDSDNRDQPRERMNMRGLLHAFRFPAKAPDFYWAFAGRFLLLLGFFMVTNFTLYILTDFIGLSNEEAGGILALSGLALLVSTAIGTFVAGPLSDRIGRRKMPIFVAVMLFVVALALPLIFQTGWSMIAFTAVAGLGLGAFLSVDTALMTEVLPSDEEAGKDLGILNTANTVPAIVAPIVTSTIVASGLGYPPVFIVSIVIVLIGGFSIFKIKSVR
ncbi:MFS transporter [Microbacterium sp. LWH7-1.2]|uniref:MFS transporter n=1 Tax=Microbacterium sp. LWH7-1.2 TaxID=3135257 RepID=UPI0031392314